MAINFPSTVGQATDGTFTYTAAGITYSWNGESWTAAGSGATATDLTVFSVTNATASGGGSLAYNSNSGNFTFTPPDLDLYYQTSNFQTNIALGLNAGVALTTGNNNVYLGNNAGVLSTNQTDNVFIGKSAGQSDQGSYNIVIGSEAGDLYGTTVGNVENIFIGRNAGVIEQGSGNIAIGMSALCNGSGSGYFNSFGNVAIGYQAMGRGSSGLDGADYNICIGQQAGFTCVNAQANIMLGDYAGSTITDGQKNIILGTSAASGITTGSNNIILNAGNYQNGTTSGFTASTSNSLWIGQSSYPWITGTSFGNTRNVTIPGQLTAGFLIAGGLTYPTTNGTSGQVLTSNGSGGVSWGSISGLKSRTTAGVTASALVSNGISNTSIVTPRTYVLHKIETSHAAWVTLYTDTTSRTADASRTETTDPTPGSGVLAEVITTGATTQLITPGVICFNSGGTEATYLKIVNKSGATANLTVTLYYVQLEA